MPSGSGTNSFHHIDLNPNKIQQMKGLMIYFSVHHGNTEEIAKTMANISMLTWCK
jgi:hypothetical protein